MYLSTQDIMSKHEDSWDKLETEFDHFLLDMKPYVLKHPNRTGEIRCHLCSLQLKKSSDKIKTFMYVIRCVMIRPVLCLSSSHLRAPAMCHMDKEAV